MIVVVAAVICHQGRILVTRRPKNVHLGGLWEFPGGKVERGESLSEALVREIREELGVQISVGSQVISVEHHYPDRSVRLHFFNCALVSGDARPLQALDLQWLLPEELDQFRFPEADQELLAVLKHGP